MLNCLSSAKATAVLNCLVVMICLAALSPLAADNDPKPTPAGAGANLQPADVTRTLRVQSPSVAVRANPEAKPSGRDTGAGGTRAGQFIHLDQDGRPISSPPTGITAPIPTRSRTVNPISPPSAAGPDAIFLDTSDIRAVVVGRVDANGRIVVDCLDDADAAATDHNGHAHDNERLNAKVSPNRASREER